MLFLEVIIIFNIAFWNSLFDISSTQLFRSLVGNLLFHSAIETYASGVVFG
jgi:hypothetical protein